MTASCVSLVRPVQPRWNNLWHSLQSALLAPVRMALLHLPHLPFRSSSGAVLVSLLVCNWLFCVTVSFCSIHSWHVQYPPGFLTLKISPLDSSVHLAWLSPPQLLHFKGDVLALNFTLQVIQLSVSATGGPDSDPGAGPEPPWPTHLQDVPARCWSLFNPLHSCCLWDSAMQLSSSHVSGRYCDLNFPLQVMHIGGRLILGF